MDIKPIPDEKNFTANGHTYIMQGLTISRLKEFRKLALHFAYGMSVDILEKELAGAEKSLNEKDWVSTAVIVRTVRERLKYFDEHKEEPALLICTLILNQPDEDITQWSYEDAQRKIQDWNLEGLDYQSFFYLAANFVPGIVENLNETSLNILKGVIQKESLDFIDKLK